MTQKQLKNGRWVNDGLVSLASGMGVDGYDKSASLSYYGRDLTLDQICNAYRESWVAGKIVDIPAYDTFKKWRNWQGEADQIAALKAMEKKHGVKAKLLKALINARLVGGAAVYIGTDQDPTKPLDVTKIKRDGITHVTVLSKSDLAEGQLENDPLEPGYGRPKYYQIANSSVVTEIHHSHLVVLTGVPLPLDLVTADTYWGDSVLQSAYSAIVNADSTAGNIASLIFEANVDVFSVPDFMSSLADEGYESKIIQRFQLANSMKGINRAIVMDAEEDFTRKQVNFTNLPETLNQFLSIASAAADIPITRFLGQSPGGLSSTGDGDLNNYYDSIQTTQTLEIEPAIALLDECLIRSALGARPEDLTYKWAPLKQMSEKEVADISKTTMESAKIMFESGLYSTSVIAQVTANQLAEIGAFPGIDNLTDEDADYGFEESENTANDALPMPLYVRRDVLNSKDIEKWAKSQGFKSTLGDMHVTITYSKRAVDWMKMGEAWDDEVKIAGGPRIMERFGDAVVLLINSQSLRWRHESMIEQGCSYDFEEYQPHIPISWDEADLDLSKIEPYQGEIVLGPEVFKELKENWKESINES